METPPAVILETVQGEGGLNAPASTGQALEALCNKRGIILIVDDIQAGVGRTGTFFSFEPAGISPTSHAVEVALRYGLPLSLVCQALARRVEAAEQQRQPSAQQPCLRDRHRRHRALRTTDAFARDIQAKGEYLRKRLQGMVERFTGDLIEVKGRGMMIGVVCADPSAPHSVTARAYQDGLIIERAGPDDEVIKCMMRSPPPCRARRGHGDILERAMQPYTPPSPQSRLRKEPRGAASKCICAAAIVNTLGFSRKAPPYNALSSFKCRWSSGSRLRPCWGRTTCWRRRRCRLRHGPDGPPSTDWLTHVNPWAGSSGVLPLEHVRTVSLQDLTTVAPAALHVRDQEARELLPPTSASCRPDNPLAIVAVRERTDDDLS